MTDTVSDLFDRQWLAHASSTRMPLTTALAALPLANPAALTVANRDYCKDERPEIPRPSRSERRRKRRHA